MFNIKKVQTKATMKFRFLPAILTKVTVTVPSGGEICRDHEAALAHPKEGNWAVPWEDKCISSLSLKKRLDLPGMPTNQ